MADCIGGEELSGDYVSVLAKELKETYGEPFGYVPTRDMFYDTIYESRPGSSRLDKEAGYIMAEKLISMKR